MCQLSLVLFLIGFVAAPSAPARGIRVFDLGKILRVHDSTVDGVGSTDGAIAPSSVAG